MSAQQKRRADGLDWHGAKHPLSSPLQENYMGDLVYMEHYRQELAKNLPKAQARQRSIVAVIRRPYSRTANGQLIEQRIWSDGSTELVIVPLSEPYGQHGFRPECL